MDDRAAINVWDGLAQNLVGERCDVAFAEEEEAKDIRDGISFSPLEVHMRHSAGNLPDVNENRSYRVGHHGAARVKDAVPSQSVSVDLQMLGEC